MGKSFLSALLPALLLCMHFFTLGRATVAQKSLVKGGEIPYVLPAAVFKITALEFDELASDYLFLKTLVFIGGTVAKKNAVFVTEPEWQWIINSLEVSTDLDPYFMDPYYIGNAYIAWDARKVQEANLLLEKGSRYRTWDWTLPFFIGFNYFYFLNDNDDASKYLMEASRRPGGNPIFASLAARLAYKERRTETAISFLQEVIKNTDDEALIKRYRSRMRALNNVLSLETAVDLFRKKYRRLPVGLTELIEKRVIREIPQDPYGGSYFLDPNGIIRDTNDKDLEPYKPPRRH